MSNSQAPLGDDLIHTSTTLMARVYRFFLHHESSTGTRILLIIALAILANVAVKLVGRISAWVAIQGRAQESHLGFVARKPKFVTLLHLLTNTITAIVYFFAVGMILQECGVNLTAYLASASVIGLAVSFGSQGLVQDVVIGLTLIFSDVMDVGEMVEIAGTVVVVGRVEDIGLRFTKLINIYNQTIFIPNRTISNVSRFPDDGLFAYADIRLPQSVDKDKVIEAIEVGAQSTWGQFNAIILVKPVVCPVQLSHEGGWNFVRVQFKIWPGQGNLIETVFRQQMVSAMKVFDQNYAEWQVAVTYRTSKHSEAPDLKRHIAKQHPFITDSIVDQEASRRSVL